MNDKDKVLEYKQKDQFTKKQKWSMLNRGILNRKTWATQGINISNPNTQNLIIENNVLLLNK